jgi:Fe-S cluster biogenesis protein NfuA
MATTPDARDFQSKLQRLEALLREAEELPDPAARECMRQVVRAVLDLHATGLERLIGQLDAATLDACVADDVTAGLLLLHGLHPLDTETRVRQALDQVRPYLRSHGGGVELLDISDGVVRLRLEGSCDGCPSSAATMAQTVEEAILAKAPDVTAVELDGIADIPPAGANGRPLVALPVL